MQGTTAQAIALTTFGNAFLSKKLSIVPTDFYPGNNVFQFCEYVHFVDLSRTADDWVETGYAADPLEFFSNLERDGFYGLRLRHMPSRGQLLGESTTPDRKLAGFVGGGGSWMITPLKSKSSDIWEARWQVGNREREDRNIWQVTYGRTFRDQPERSARREVKLATLQRDLAASLEAIDAFARKHQLDDFAEIFERSKACLNASEPSQGRLGFELAPVGLLSLPAAQLLAAAQSGWVFGGMGSWNDLDFEGEEQVLYDQLSEDLYKNLISALVAAASSSLSPPSLASP